MEYPIRNVTLNFSCSLGTIKAIEQAKKKSFMAVVAGSYSSQGVCTALLADMLDILALAYAKANSNIPQDQAILDFLQFVDTNNINYTEVVQMYDKLLVSLQYPGKTEDEIEETILKNLQRVEEQRARMLNRINKK